ncbi:uncharacterized protein LOC133845826 [Drosophila sulfurigaster albostrigata]|uniref:uncharacterized protein LOC133845826 n=1 Tax=Drosophila sulfurigaster albostrigata TaxID=89887 RepID=UPI002D218B2B|nr:uncharacterized protein LOC133845826 [Drosophila sulfurigaster albostrigata]
MKLLCLVLFVSLLGLAFSHELVYGYYAGHGLSYAHTVVPLAYARLLAPATQSHLYHSVETPNSFQQQYRSDYHQPMTYEYVY